jgi:hypothetical protein
MIAAIPLVTFFIVSLFAQPVAGTEPQTATGTTGTRYAWEDVLANLETQRDQLSIQLDIIRDVLLLRAQSENTDLIERLYIDPPRRSGYQVIPAIQEDKPITTVTPDQETYSLEVLRKQIKMNVREGIGLAKQVSAEPNPALVTLVIEFERLRGQLGNIESNLAYHSYWQRAVVEHSAFFADRNRIADSVRNMQAMQSSGDSAAQAAALQQSVREQVTEFSPTTGLAIKTNRDGLSLLEVSVHTDIDDDEFLEAFQQGVEAAFTNSKAARSQQFAVTLNIRRVTPAELYPEGAPARGTAIDVDKHLGFFPQGVLILTTGAESTHAWVGRNITVGPNPVSRRVLAHEFGHLLGFSDAYLRSYQGDPQDPYGVVLVEWNGLVDNLMGSPDDGRVTENLIETLIEAYAD